MRIQICLIVGAYLSLNILKYIRIYSLMPKMKIGFVDLFLDMGVHGVLYIF